MLGSELNEPTDFLAWPFGIYDSALTQHAAASVLLRYGRHRRLHLPDAVSFVVFSMEPLASQIL